MDHAGDFYGARRLFEEALQCARAAGLERWEGGLLGNLANVHIELGKLDEASDVGEAALAIARRVGDLKFAGNTLSNLGLSDLLAGRVREAKAQFDEALSIARHIGHRQLECIALCNLGIHFDAAGSARESIVHFEQALAIGRELNDRRAQGQCLGYLGLAQARQQQFAEARRCLAEGEALLREVDDLISLALLLCSRCEAERLAKGDGAASEFLREAQAIARASGARPGSELGLALERARRSLRATASAEAPAIGC
jgi:tetratricopeptide (TPR) repeat protein